MKPPCRLILCVTLVIGVIAPLLSVAEPQKTATDLDALMEQALKRRDAGRDLARDYILNEVEKIEALAPGKIPLYRIKREYQWYVREGVHVRSPIRFDGVQLSETERRQHEDEWIASEKGRNSRRKNSGKTPDSPDSLAPSDAGPDTEPAVAPPLPDLAKPTLATPIPEPRFVSDAYFFSYRFKPGNYYLAGREKFDGHEVLRVEYYPDTRTEVSSNKALVVDRRFDKTSLITLWVDPAEHQIVKFTFENVWLDFLPAQWMVQVKGITASMIMEHPFKDVWLPHNMTVHVDLTLANGNFELGLTRDFSNYKHTDVTTRIDIPGSETK